MAIICYQQSSLSLKNGFTVWRQSQKEDFLSILQYINAWLSMMSGHGANPVFVNKKVKIGHPEHSLLTIPPPSKWTMYVYRPLR